MDILDYFSKSNVPLDTKNKNEVKHLQSSINALYKSPFVQKEKGKTVSLKVDGIWGPKTEGAAKELFGKVPTLAELGAVQFKYSEMAREAVEAKSSGLNTLVNIGKKLVLSPVEAVKQVYTAASGGNPVAVNQVKQIIQQTKEVKQGTSPLIDEKTLERKIMEAANKAAQKAVEARVVQQDPAPTESTSSGNNKILIIGAAAAVAILLILK